MSFPKISRQFFDYFPKLVDTLPNFVDTFLKKVDNHPKLVDSADCNYAKIEKFVTTNP